MAAGALQKVYITLGVIISLSWTGLADNEVQNRSKYKYGYVISHKGGSSQAHLESRDGNLALGRYYVDLQNGTGQKVTYFADDLGFHSGVFYSSQNGKGSSKAHIALGHKALAASGNSDITQSTALLTPTLLFGKKLLNTAFNTVASKPGAYPQLNYTPVPGGFLLTHQSVEASNDTADRVPDSTSSGHATGEDAYSAEAPQSESNAQSFYPTSENVKNVINELHIESTTPSIKSYSPLPQQSSLFSPTPQEASGLSQPQNPARPSSHPTAFDDLSYSKQKSIEKTTFADIDAQIISEVQKHAEAIIVKDLQRDQQANEIARLSSATFRPFPVTVQPIVVTNDGETGLNTVLPVTAVPEARKLTEAVHLNAVQTTGKNPNQTLGVSGYFRFPSSPSLPSSVNVSQTPHKSINVESTDRNSDSNNSTLCGFNLCEKGNDQILPADLLDAKPKKEIKGSGRATPDASEGLGSDKIVRTFYPENKLHDERHYITTIDVQKAISLDFNQNEAKSVHFAQNFPFDKIKPFNEVRTQTPIPQPLVPGQISVSPAAFAPELSLNILSTPQKPYISNTVTTAPGLNDLSNQNLAVLNGLNDITSSQHGTPFQERVGTNRYEYENQLVVPPPPVDLTNQAAVVSGQSPQEDFREVEKNIQELRQQILSDIDAQHEDEQRKQNLVDQERKQYFQNLQKVETLKSQNSLSYSLPVLPQSDAIQSTTSSPTSSGSVTNVQLVPQTQYTASPQTSYDSPPQLQYDRPQQTHYQPTDQSQYNQLQQTDYESSVQTQYDPSPPQAVFEPPSQTYQTEIKAFRHEIAVPQPNNIHQIADPAVYQKPAALPYDSRELQTSGEDRQYDLYDSQNVYHDSNNLQQSAPTYKTENIQLSDYAASQVNGAVAFQPRYAVPRVATVQEKPKQIQQLTVLNGQLNALPLGLATGVLPQAAKVPPGKTLLLNNALPLDYGRYLQIQQPLSLLQTYPVALPTESKIVQGIYPAPVQFSQSYKLAYPEVAAVADKQYHSTLIQRPINKLRVQPLKPSTPDEGNQREAVQNLLSQPQFHRTYLYPGFPIDNRLQLRHIRKSQISNSDQVRSQSVRRAKSLKNLRIEYGFKPPLRPSVEFTEEVKPSIYGSSVQPQ